MDTASKSDVDRSLTFRRSLRDRWLRLLGLTVADAAPRSGPGDHVAIGEEGVNQVDSARRPATPAIEGLRPGVADLSPAQRAALAEAWRRDGMSEHASVAAFGRFALELLAVGAPSGLVADAHRAALDEVQHARLCLELASAYAGEAIVPGPFDFGRGLAVGADLPAMSTRTFLHVCAGETLATVKAAEQLAVATDPAARTVLAMIVEDGVRHAELGFRTVAWALETGGEPVREALRDAMSRLTIPASTPAEPELHAHGQLDDVAVRLAMARALRDVVLPCARALVDGVAPADGEGSVAA